MDGKSINKINKMDKKIYWFFQLLLIVTVCP